MKGLLSKARARLSKVRLSKVYARRPLALALSAALLVALVGVTVLWQVRAHASPDAVSANVVSDTSDTVTDGSYTGNAVYTYGHIACPALDSNNLCTAGDVPPHGFTQVAWPLVSDAHWIWETQLSQSSQNNHAITFSKAFDIPANNTTSITGNIQIAADNEFDLQVNGTEVGTSKDWQTVSTFPLNGILHAGQNTITVEVTNDGNFDPWGNPGGLIYDLGYSYVPDITPPVTTESFSGLSGSNGWYRGPGAVTLQAGDLDDATSTLTTYYNMDGSSSWNTYSSPLPLGTDGQYTIKYFSIDLAGNVEATKMATINLDQTRPDLHINGPASTTYSYCAGTVPTRPTFAPTDNLSGLDGSQGDSWTTPSSATGAGTYTYSAHARDMAGNTAVETRTYTVAYGSAFSGVLAPVSADGSSSFTLGSTIPVKFQLLCNGVPVTNAVASLMVSQNGSAPGKAISTSAATTGNLFRYDSTSQQYIFNLSTKNGYTSSDGSTAAFTAGTWTLTIVLDDGSSQAYSIALS